MFHDWGCYGVRELVADLIIEKLGHDSEGFRRFGELEVIPEGVRKGLENYQMGVDAGAEEGAMEEGGVAEEKVARAGDEKARRHAFQVGEDGGEDGVFSVGVAGVFLANGAIGILRVESAGKAVEGKELQIGRA